MTRGRPATFLASAVPDAPPAPRRRRLLELRGHPWTPPERAILISLVAIAMGSLFVTTYSLTLGDPIPRHINAAIVGDGRGALTPAEARYETPKIGALAKGLWRGRSRGAIRSSGYVVDTLEAAYGRSIHPSPSRRPC